MLEVESGVEAIKRRGVRVIRAVIPKHSNLIGTTAAETNFRSKYKAAIIAVNQSGLSTSKKLSQVSFSVGDVLVLQVNNDSPLLQHPPKDFYRKLGEKGKGGLARSLMKRFNSIGSSLSDHGGGGSISSKMSSDDEVGKERTPQKASPPDEEKSNDKAQDAVENSKMFEFYIDEVKDESSVDSIPQKNNVSLCQYEYADYPHRYLFSFSSFS